MAMDLYLQSIFLIPHEVVCANTMRLKWPVLYSVRRHLPFAVFLLPVADDAVRQSLPVESETGRQFIHLNLALKRGRVALREQSAHLVQDEPLLRQLGVLKYRANKAGETPAAMSHPQKGQSPSPCHRCSVMKSRQRRPESKYASSSSVTKAQGPA